MFTAQHCLGFRARMAAAVVRAIDNHNGDFLGQGIRWAKKTVVT